MIMTHIVYEPDHTPVRFTCELAAINFCMALRRQGSMAWVEKI